MGVASSKAVFRQESDIAIVTVSILAVARHDDPELQFQDTVAKATAWAAPIIATTISATTILKTCIL